MDNVLDQELIELFPFFRLKIERVLVLLKTFYDHLEGLLPCLSKVKLEGLQELSGFFYYSFVFRVKFVFLLKVLDFDVPLNEFPIQLVEPLFVEENGLESEQVEPHDHIVLLLKIIVFVIDVNWL